MLMDIDGKQVKTGYGLWETLGSTNDESTRRRDLIAAYDDENEAMLAMRDKAEDRYDDPLEYNRYLIYGGKGIRFEHIDPETQKADSYHDFYVKPIGLIL